MSRSSDCWSPARCNRIRTGFLLPLVLVLFSGVLVLTCAGLFSSSAGARTEAAAFQFRALLDAACLSTAAVMHGIRQEMAEEPAGWRRELTPPYAGRSHPSSRSPAPLAEHLLTEFGARLSPVDVRVVDWFDAGAELRPQGLIETSVKVEIRHALRTTGFRVVQRWAFVVWPRLGGPLTSTIGPADIEVFLGTVPVATVICPSGGQN